MNRTKITTKNIGFAMIGQFTNQILNFLVRTVFIYTLSIEYLGVNGLFTNILSILSLAELGVGHALIYLMYKPLAEKNVNKIQVYMHLYKKIYRVLGLTVLTIGLLITPFLDFFIAQKTNIRFLEFIYILYVLKTVSTYFLAYKQSIFQADQKNYIIVQNTIIFTILLSILQIIILLLTKNFIIYILINVVIFYLQNIRIALLANKHYPYLKKKISIELNTKEEIKDIKKNAGALFYHKIGAVILNSSDNIIMSKFLGLAVVGLYSNYALILTVVKTSLWTVFDNIIPSVGNLIASEINNKDKIYKVFANISLLNLWISGFCSISLIILINPFITLWLGKGLIIDELAVWTIVFSFYLQTNMRAIEMFREATGLFYKDRYIPLIQCVINIVISIVLVKQLGIAGVFIGTSLSILTTGFWVQPFMVYKYIFNRPLGEYYGRFCKYTLVTILAFLLTYWSAGFLNIGFIAFVYKVTCCLVIPNLVFLTVYWRSTEFQIIKEKIFQLINKRKNLI